MEAQWSISESVGGPEESRTPTKDRYKNGKPYKNFNIAKEGKGMWWIGVQNPKMKKDPRSTQCDKPWFWVDKGTAPDVPEAISPKLLAQLAYQETQVPEVDVSMNPEGRQTVNLPTWMWLDVAKFKPVSVTASLPGTGLWATTTATPTSLHIEPGTEEAEVFPRSGNCLIGKGGSIGTPYSADKKNQTPPCGITYLRSTANTGPHELNATLTWKITWKGSNGQGGELPDGTFGTATDVTVQEVQAVNR
ncbi:hypothetical protein [Streptomyces sp. 7N604]|uniref:hypothetical protein n=1 Tax=Streptomyces sp. 7N604 TaxID=3457415 RepID=UPI003FD598ED